MKVKLILCVLASLYFTLCLASEGSKIDRSADELEMQLHTALSATNLDDAHQFGTSLYELSRSQNDAATAGKTAYVLASVENLRGRTDQVPIWFDRCANQYGLASAFAQQVDCLYRAALSYKSTNKLGTVRNRLRSAETVLEVAGEANSPIAEIIYAELAESYAPPQFETTASADEDRNRVLTYSKMAREILGANSQENSFLYAMLLAREAVALEDLHRFNEAETALLSAIAISQDFPEAQDLQTDLRRRLMVVSSRSSSKKINKNRYTVQMPDGRDVQLKVIKRSRVSYPEANGTAARYGLVRVLVQLDANGDVFDVSVIESLPNPAFGESVKKAMLKWAFVPMDDTKPEAILPFEYTMTFDLVRRK